MVAKVEPGVAASSRQQEASPSPAKPPSEIHAAGLNAQIKAKIKRLTEAEKTRLLERFSKQVKEGVHRCLFCATQFKEPKYVLKHLYKLHEQELGLGSGVRNQRSPSQWVLRPNDGDRRNRSGSADRRGGESNIVLVPKREPLRSRSLSPLVRRPVKKQKR